MVRWLVGLVLVGVGACSDDGVPAGGSESTATSGSATLSSTAGPDTAPTSDPTASSGPPTSGTTEDEPTSTGDPPGSTSGVQTSSSDDTTDSASSGSASESSSGSSGSTGDSSGSTSTGGDPGMACMGNDDCVLVDDCCTCAAQHVDDPPPECDVKDCDVTACDAQNIGGIDVECTFGSCEFVPVQCHEFFLECGDPPPDCGEMLPSIVDGCWGPCVPSEACDIVPGCDWCPADEACVETTTQLGFLYACVPIDPSCNGTPDCDCMGVVCQDPFECGDAGMDGDLGCQCPVCG